MLANTGDGAAHKNKSLICVPMKTKGVNVARKLDKLGMRASDTAQIFFEDVNVPLRYTSARRARASPTRCSSSRKSDCGPAPAP